MNAITGLENVTGYAMFVATKAIEYYFHANDVRVYNASRNSVAIPVLVACSHRLLSYSRHSWA